MNPPLKQDVRGPNSSVEDMNYWINYTGILLIVIKADV